MEERKRGEMREDEGEEREDTDEERETIFCNNITTARLEPEIFLAQISIFFAQPVTFEENAIQTCPGHQPCSEGKEGKTST